MYKFGDRLKELRCLRGLTQRELANVLGVTDGAVTLWESNARMPSIPLLVQIADYFGVSVDYLLGRTDDPRPSFKTSSPADSYSAERDSKRDQQSETATQLPPWLSSLPEDMRKFVIKEARNGWPFMRLAYGASLNDMEPYELEAIIETWIDAKRRYEQAKKQRRNNKQP